jgi:cytochrome c peroxidase
MLSIALLCVTAQPDCRRAEKNTARQGGTGDASRHAPAPIPEADPLALPKSLDQVGVPVAATRAAYPPDNPQTPQKIALGEKLFFDGRLPVDGIVACSTCHDPVHAFTDGRPASIGIDGRTGRRKAPTILNALYNKTRFWDGRCTHSRSRQRYRS